MTEFTAHAVGAPCWVDLMTPDTEGAKRFCSSVFGWTAEDQTDDDGNYTYTLFHHGGRIAAGMGAQPPEMAGVPAVWNTYIATDDPAAVAAKVEAAGGSVIMPPMQVMEAGSMAVFADPTGAAFSVWKAGNHLGAEVANDPDTWSWNELMSRDVATAAAFYAEVFGWAYDEMDMGEPTGLYRVIQGGANNEGMGGLMAMPADVPEMVPNHWAVYFMTDDIDASVAKAKNADGMVQAGPMEIPGVGMTAVLHHEAAGSFNLLQPASAEG